MKLIYTTEYVEIYDGTNRVALHQRSYRKYGNSTVKSHMPANHQHMLETRGYDGSDFLHEAQQVGLCAVEVVERMIRKAHYVQHTYALWQAFRRLKRNYGKDRLEAACKRLNNLEQVTCRALENVLKKGLDHQQAYEQISQPIIRHENLRGPQAY